MSAKTAQIPPLRIGYRKSIRQYAPDFHLGLENLLSHKLRSLLTMLGMIFGVAAVVSMLSIGEGAQQKVMAFIQQMGVRNLIVEAKEPVNNAEMQKLHRVTEGLSFADYRAIRKDVSGVVASTPRKRFAPSEWVPKPQQDSPVVYGVDPDYEEIVGLTAVDGRFFGEAEDADAAPVCVLGSAAKLSLFGSADPIGKYVKVDTQWLHVIGVVAPQLSAQTEIAGMPSQDSNNLIYAPLNAVVMRMADSQSYLKDEIDGIYLQLSSADDSPKTADAVRSLLNVTHHNANDFSVIVPAELLAEQRRTERLFSTVMVAIASISLLVGGIGIMNIMLAGILERTREIGVRRAVGARKSDIVRQFVVEAVLISFAGGVLGIFFGFGMSRLIALLAGWSTIVTAGSILLAFLVSISVGLIFGIYPAVKAARLDPVEAIRYE